MAMPSGKSIRLKEFGTIRLRDRSCSWSHRMMILVGEGDKTAIAMLKCLKPNIHAVVDHVGDAPSYERDIQYDVDALMPVDEFIALGIQAA